MRPNLPWRSHRTGRQKSSRGRGSGETHLWNFGVVLAAGFAAAALGLVGLTWLAWTLLHHPKIPNPHTISVHDTVGLLQLVFATVAGAGALVALIVAYRKQKVAEADSAHDRTRVFNERFTAIAAQLGHDEPAVRLAGVHAMAGLADDWKANRQTCVDVLCAYLRMPYKPYPGDQAPADERLAFHANREVRHTVIRVITAHLRDDAAESWQGLDFDLTGVIFDGGDFNDAKFSGGTISFSGAEFSGGEVSFHGAKFCGADVRFNDAKFSGAEVDFFMTEFSGGTVGFYGAKFSGAAVRFGGEFSGAEVDFSGAEFSGGIVVFGSEFSGGIVVFSGARFSGSTVNFSYASFSGGTVTFSDSFTTSSIGPDGRERNITHVTISSAEFSGGEVSFGRAKFSGGKVDFGHAEFSGSKVDFSDVDDWSVPPSFPWTGGPPPGVKLPQKQDQSQV